MLALVSVMPMAAQFVPKMQQRAERKAPLIPELVSNPHREVRAVWLTTIGGIDWPHSYASDWNSQWKQKQELIRILDKLKAANINTVMLQTRVRGTVIYPSVVEPWDGCMSGKPGVSPGYDPLKFAIEECHKRGMEIHAWLVTVPVGKWNSVGCTRLRTKYPHTIKKIGEDGFMNPEDPVTAQVVASIAREIVTKYDIDGINLDYIRYPETWTNTGPKSDARENISYLAERVHDEVKLDHPWVKISCSPIGKSGDLTRYSSKGWNAFNKGCQDAQGWLRDGLMDQLYPMIYFRDDNFYPFLLDWQQNSYGRTIVAGLGIYFLDPKEGKWVLSDVTRQMEVSRHYGVGHCFFRSKFFTDNVKGIYDFTKDKFNTYPALTPALTWEDKRAPSTPGNLQVKRHGTYDELTWTSSSDPTDSPNVLYNVYASDEPSADLTADGNLIAIRVEGNRFVVPRSARNRKLWYTVTAMNRYGNESAGAKCYVRL